MRHLLEAVAFVLVVAAFTGVMWVLLAFPRHAHRRILMMLDTGWPGKRGYGWRDAGVLLRRHTKRENGPDPGKHRSGKPERQQPRPVTMVAMRPQRRELEPVLGFTRADVENDTWPPPEVDEGSRTWTMPVRQR